MINGKNFKIWGIGYGIIGDIIMALPLLPYFEKKYPDSYKILVIQKKCAICAPLFLNHPLIDKIKITDEWSGVGKEDIKLANQCQIKDKFWTGKPGRANPKGGWHDDSKWHNKRSCIEETARIYGVLDLMETLTKDELYPKLYKWFDVGRPNAISTYSKSNTASNDEFKNSVAIWPFASSGHKGRSPSVSWWKKVIDALGNKGISVFHYGRDSEAIITDHPKYFKETRYCYFDQVKMAIASQVVIGPDSGSMWVMGAYSHPAINLVTNFLPNHNSNLLALNPINRNATTLFEKNGCDNIPLDKIISSVQEKIQ